MLLTRWMQNSHHFAFELFIFPLWLPVITWITTERLCLYFKIYSHGFTSLLECLCSLVLPSLVFRLSRWGSADWLHSFYYTSKKCQTKVRQKFVPVGLEEALSDLTQSTTVRKHCHLRKSKCLIIAARQMHLHKTPGSGPQTTDRTSLRLIFFFSF